MSKQRKFRETLSGLLYHNNELVKTLENLPGFEEELKVFRLVVAACSTALTELDHGQPFEEVEARWSKAIAKATPKKD